MAKTKITAPVIVDPSTLTPKNSAEFLARGWIYYALARFEEAILDIQTSIKEDPLNADAYYALGLCLKLTGASQQALDAFGKIDQLTPKMEEKQRAMIIGRLAHGQINQIKTGDWNLEKEVWLKTG